MASLSSSLIPSSSSDSLSANLFLLAPSLPNSCLQVGQVATLPLQSLQSRWYSEHPKMGAAASTRQTGHSRLASFLAMESSRKVRWRPSGEGEEPPAWDGRSMDPRMIFYVATRCSKMVDFSRTPCILH